MTTSSSQIIQPLASKTLATVSDLPCDRSPRSPHSAVAGCRRASPFPPRWATAAAVVITAQWRAMTAAAMAMSGPGGVGRGSPRAAKAAISSTVIVIDSLSATTVGIGSSTAASRSAAMTLTASIIAIGYLGTASGSGLTVPLTTRMGTIAGGCDGRPSSPEVHIGGVATTLAWGITNHPVLPQSLSLEWSSPLGASLARRRLRSASCLGRIRGAISSCQQETGCAVGAAQPDPC
jgi:hypothetical protein